jgi:uncharacterized protein
MHSLLEKNREAILGAAARHGARNVRVFGSFIHGEQSTGSDVDLLVEAGPNAAPFFPCGLKADLEELLGRSVDVLTPDAIHWFIRDRVLAEAVAL